MSEPMIKCYKVNGIVLNTVIGQNATDKIEQYADACKQIKVFHAKWNELRFPANCKVDADKVASYEQRVLGFIDSAKRAKADAALLGKVDVQTLACIKRMKETSK